MTIPDAAQRVVIRPVLGPGGSQPLYECRFEVGAEPTEKQVRSAVAGDVEFWAYIDAKVRAKKLELARDGAWSWKLRLQFYNQVNTEEVLLTDDTYEFYRLDSASAAGDGNAESRFAQFAERALAVIESVGKASVEAIAKVGEHATVSISAAVTAAGTSTAASADAAAKSITASVTAGSTAVAEATKQTAVVSEMAKALQEETLELKTALIRALSVGPKPQQAAASSTQQLRELLDVGKTMFDFADTWSGAKPAAPTKPSGAT